MDIKKLNDSIDDLLKNRLSYVPYQLLEEISKRITFEIKIPDIHQIDSPTKCIPMDKTVEVVLGFLKQLDSKLYEKAKSIIGKESDVEFRMYNIKSIKNFDETDANGAPLYSCNGTGWTGTLNGKKYMYVPCKEILNDCFTLIHELAHIFDSFYEHTLTSEFFDETTSYIFEAMLGEYLTGNNSEESKDVINYEKSNIIIGYYNSVETYAKLMLMKIKYQNGEITERDLENLEKACGLDQKVFKFIIGDIMSKKPKNVNFKARYMNATMIYPYFLECYFKPTNPQEAIARLKKYIESVKRDDFNDALENLGIDPKSDWISLLINVENRRIKQLYERQKALDSQENNESVTKKEAPSFEDEER